MSKWKRVGSSVYMKGEYDSFVWREGRKWFRTGLPMQTIRIAMQSVGMSPLGLLSKSTRPYSTMLDAQRKNKYA